MSNIHYCDYKIKYRSKLETLATHHSYKIHIPRDKILNQCKLWVLFLHCSLCLISGKSLQPVSVSKVSTITWREKQKKKKKKSLYMVWLILNRKVRGFVCCLALNGGKVGKSHQGQVCFLLTAMEVEAVRFSLLLFIYLSDFTVTMAEILVLVPAHLSGCLLTESLKIQWPFVVAARYVLSCQYLLSHELHAH